MRFSERLQPEPKPTGVPARFAPDLRWQDWLVEIRLTSTLRDLRGSLLELAYHLHDRTDFEEKALIVLVDSKISSARLMDELQRFRRITRGEIGSRIHLARFQSKDQLFEAFDAVTKLPSGLPDLIFRKIAKEASRSSGSAAPSAQHAVTGQLVRAWLANSRKLSSTELQELVGASYPTVANALKQLEAKGLLDRNTDRSVALRHLPLEEWQHWLVSAVQARRSVAFIDPTRAGRSPAKMAERLFKLGRDNVAVGGVLGARHFYPQLDIAGEPRLDITLHNSTDVSFVRRLDAGLRQAAPSEKPSLIVHFTSGSHPPFVSSPEGIWADPLECLVDLYEMGLYTQAQEFLEQLLRKHRNPDASFRAL